ncbi:MAG: cation diffusion facilitator family transporter [Sphingomonas pseudosanguinis]|uniref:cation diffusion facilitator family transporter n=1 Tax=Sphingomonas pseudosanguinis TaxID=413712 RepID=UPI003918DF75
MQTEQGILRLSIAVTFLMAVLGAVIGLIAGSSAIMFDGVYGLIDAVMTGLALMVARLIAASNAADAMGQSYSKRFTMGFWHLEPIVLGVNGMLLTGAALYAMLDATRIILGGGHAPSFGAVLIYTGISLIIDLGMAFYVRRANRSIGSEFVAMDARSWGMTAALSGSLFASFVIGHAIDGGRWAWMTPYIDPVALLIICIVIIPVPIASVRKALSEILLVTPYDLRVQVEDVADRIDAAHGFLGHRAFVARVGRGIQIELNFIVPRHWPARRLEEWDALRDEIGQALGHDSPDLWLTIVFTTDPEWVH